MSANRRIRVGPVALSATLTTNILNPAIVSLAGPVGITLTQPYIILDHLRIVNKTAAPQSASLWIGATGGNAAGTEFLAGQTVAANSEYNYYGSLRLDAADFLVGGASAGTSLTLEGEGEIGFS